MKTIFTVFLVPLFLFQLSCTISESEGRKCLKDANRCKPAATLAVDAIKEKGLNHCHFTKNEINFWQQSQLKLPARYEKTALSSGWLGALDPETHFLNINFQEKQGFCLFEINDPQHFDLNHYLDLSLKQIKD